MSAHRKRSAGFIKLALLGFFLLPAACRRSDDPGRQQSQKQDSQAAPPASRPAPVTAAQKEENPILPESLAWTREQTLERLKDEKTALSAAVRLVRLTETRWPAVPDPLPMETARKLRLLPLGNGQYALGLRDEKNERAVRAPLLLEETGTVTQLSEPEEYLVLYASTDAEVFPHLLIAPGCVSNLAQHKQPAILLKTQKNLCFELRSHNGFSYVALACTLQEPAVEVARYLWDTDERMFAGPAVDKLPDPPGGKFEIDLSQSAGLQPVGGEIPEIQPNNPPPGQQDAHERWDA